MTDRIELTCGKCNGNGSLNWVGGYADGVCFDCKGSGKAGTITSEEQRRNVVNGLGYTANIVLEAVSRGATERARFYARGMVADLFRVGTAAAREVLDYVAAGKYWDDDSQAFGQAAAVDAAAIRAYIVEEGRKAKAAH